MYVYLLISFELNVTTVNWSKLFNNRVELTTGCVGWQASNIYRFTYNK